MNRKVIGKRNMTEIPRTLLNDIETGNVVLFLGAGASMGCKLPSGESPPSGQRLADILAKEFLNDTYVGYSLEEVAELAINQVGLYRVQSFIAQFFDRFQPTDAHRAIASFRWHGIATTNYDLVLERAYDQAKNRAQLLKPVFRNGDRIEALLKGGKAVAYMKLHGA